MIYENMAALFLFACFLGGCALGYIMRNYLDGAMGDWNAYAYRHRQARKRTAYRRANNDR